MLAPTPTSRSSPPPLPSALLAAELGPAVMADDPCEAAFSGVDPTGPRKYYRARYYDPKIGRFISEDPIGFDGGVNFFAYVGNNPVNFGDPFGLQEIPGGWGSPGPWGRPPSTPTGRSAQQTRQFWEEFGGGAGAMWSNYQQMVNANTRGVDLYFHCMANCQAAQQGPGGRAASHAISSVREAWGVVKGDPWSDINRDMSANSCGRNAGNRPCHAVCSPYLPPGFF